MSLYDIRASIDTDPFWFVIPSHLEALKNKIDAYLGGNMPPAQDDGGDEGEPLPPDTRVIDVCGVINKRIGLPAAVCDFVGLCDLDFLAKDLKAAIKDESLRNVILNFNSPGGYIVGLPECSALINELGITKTVFAYTDVVCASAAYELFAQAKYCYCAPSAIVGSIGTVGTFVNVSQALKAQGIDVTVIASGKYKALTDPKHAPLTKEDKAYLEAGVMKEANRFKNSVLSKRNVSPEHMDGQTFAGEEAVQNNLADGLFNDLPSLIAFVSRLNIYTQGK